MATEQPFGPPYVRVSSLVSTMTDKNRKRVGLTHRMLIHREDGTLGLARIKWRQLRLNYKDWELWQKK